MKKMENKIVYLKDFTADEIYRLINFLRKKSNAKTDDATNRFILDKLHKFFIGLTVIQENELYDLIVVEDTIKMKEFIEKYPDIQINKEGKNVEERVPAWKVKHDSLIISYKELSSQTNLDSTKKQILKARTLSCLKNIKPKYTLGQLIFKLNKMQTVNVLLIKYIQEHVEKLKEYFDSEAFFRKLLTYFINNTNQEIFLKYVFYYLDIIIADTKNESVLKSEYIQTINNIL